jgi:CMD domain protein
LAADGIIERLVGIAPGSELAVALVARSQIMDLSQAAHDAVLSPRDPGGLSYAERAALAERMARIHGDAAAAAHYAALPASGESGREALSDPAATPQDGRRAALARHVDLLTRSPREATRGDIDALREAGISEPDIVRLSELIAFGNYQLRVVAGLRLLQEAA